MWLLKSTKSIAFQKDLYSSLNGDEECDEIERWLNEQFETPVKEPLSKAINGDKLDYNNWKKLIDYFPDCITDVISGTRIFETCSNMDEMSLFRQNIDFHNL